MYRLYNHPASADPLARTQARTHARARAHTGVPADCHGRLRRLCAWRGALLSHRLPNAHRGAPATSAPGLGSPPPRPHQDLAHTPHCDQAKPDVRHRTGRGAAAARARDGRGACSTAPREPRHCRRRRAGVRLCGCFLGRRVPCALALSIPSFRPAAPALLSPTVRLRGLKHAEPQPESGRCYSRAERSRPPPCAASVIGSIASAFLADASDCVAACCNLSTCCTALHCVTALRLRCSISLRITGIPCDDNNGATCCNRVQPLARLQRDAFCADGTESYEWS